MRIVIDYGPMPMEHIRDELRLHYRKPKAICIMVCSIALLAGIGISLAEIRVDAPWPFGWGFPLFVAGCAGLLIPLVILPVVMPNVCAELYRQTGNHCHIVLDEAGIFEEVEGANVFHTWEAVKTYKEDEKGFNIYFAGGLWVHLPKLLLSDIDIDHLEKKLAALR